VDAELTPDEARRLIASWGVDWASFPLVRAPDVDMDVDPEVLAWGSSGKGAVVRGSVSAERYATRPGPTTIIDGDLHVHGLLENRGMLVVKGNLRAQGILTSDTYLVVLGDLEARRLLGMDESYGTYVVGRAELEETVMLWNHHMGVAGGFHCREVFDDEDDRAATYERLVDWGAWDPEEQRFDEAALRAALS